MDENLKDYDAKEVETLVQVALLCTQNSPEERPKMVEVVSMLQGVGLAERWAEWEQLEEVRNQEFFLLPHRFLWAEESTKDQEAVQLSQARYIFMNLKLDRSLFSLSFGIGIYSFTVYEQNLSSILHGMMSLELLLLYHHNGYLVK